MELRFELQFPQLDKPKVHRLSELAAAIDGDRPGEWEHELAEFNQLAGTSLECFQIDKETEVQKGIVALDL